MEPLQGARTYQAQLRAALRDARSRIDALHASHGPFSRVNETLTHGARDVLDDVHGSLRRVSTRAGGGLFIELSSTESAASRYLSSRDVAGLVRARDAVRNAAHVASGLAFPLEVQRAPYARAASRTVASINDALAAVNALRIPARTPRIIAGIIAGSATVAGAAVLARR